MCKEDYQEENKNNWLPHIYLNYFTIANLLTGERRSMVNLYDLWLTLTVFGTVKLEPQKMVAEKSSFSANPLEQFVLLAKTAKGAACTELVKQVLEAPGVYVFGELLDMPNIAEVRNVTSMFEAPPFLFLLLF